MQTLAQNERIDSILKLMEYDVLNPSQEEWVSNLEISYKRKGFLTEREMEVLEDIFAQAAQRA